MEIITFYMIIIFALILTFWHKFYRWAFFPKRDPDFEYRLYVYWFDEKVAYSKWSNKTKIKFYEYKGILFRDDGPENHVAKLQSPHQVRYVLEKEVQFAYKNHINKKFEDIFLNE